MRPVSSVWSYFITDKIGKKKIATCRYCSKKYSFPNATKMAKHISECVKRPLEFTFLEVLEGTNYEVIASEPVLSDLTCFILDVAAALPTDASNLINVVLSDVESTSSTTSTYFVPQVIQEPVKKNSINTNLTLIQ